MSNKYLNKNVQFKCENGNAVFFSPQNGCSKLKIKGAEALLDDCRICLIGGPRLGQCNLVPDPATGAPGMCTSVMVSGSWNNNVTVKAEGKGVLSSACSISCPVGGTVKPFNPSFSSINVDDGAKAQSASITRLSGSAGEAGSKSAEPADITFNALEIGASEGVEADYDKEESETEAESALKTKYALCDYENCGRAKDCEYLRTAHTLKETNESKNAAELKSNMETDAPGLYTEFDAEECADIDTSLYGIDMYSIAHHHIIPVNQCFKDFPEIVKLANYYGYNINKAENGVLLPTMNVGYDKQPFDLRKSIAFEAMEALGKQWHKGGHSYACKVSEKIDRVLPKPFKNYKDAVDDVLTRFSIRLNDEIICRANNYEKQAADFIKTMDHICARVTERLRRFEDCPQESYPFFVSKLAFYFAFQDKLSEHEEDLFGREE